MILTAVSEKSPHYYLTVKRKHAESTSRVVAVHQPFGVGAAQREPSPGRNPGL